MCMWKASGRQKEMAVARRMRTRAAVVWRTAAVMGSVNTKVNTKKSMGNWVAGAGGEARCLAGRTMAGGGCWGVSKRGQIGCLVLLVLVDMACKQGLINTVHVY